MNLDLFCFLQSFQIYLCHYSFVDWMLVYYCKTEVTAIKFCKKGKKGKGRYLGLQSFNISSFVYCSVVGRGWRGFVEDDTKKKKIHQLRIWSPPLKLYLNNMFRFCLKPFRTTSPRIHHYLRSWAIKDDTFCCIMNCSVVWTKVTYFNLCNTLVISSSMSVMWEEI